MNKLVVPPRVSKEALEVYDPDQWDLIPLHRYGDTSKRNGKLRKDGKRPLDVAWASIQYNSRQVVERCLKENRNVGVRLRADQLVIDVDLRRDGDKGFKNLCDDFGLDPSVWPCVITGSGGYHFYLFKPAEVLIVDTLAHESDSRDVKRYSGVEFKSRGRQVVAAGSIHPDTLRHYQWDSFSLPPSDARECPAVLLSAIRRPERMSKAATRGGQYTPEQIAHALDRLSPEHFRDHDKWLRLMMAVHSASNGDARHEFIEWSVSDPLYADDAEIIGRRWDSLHAERYGGVTFRTLKYFLRENGAIDALPAPADASDDFDGLDDGASNDRDLKIDAWLDGKPEKIDYDETKLPEMLDQIEDAMLAAGVPLFQTGGRLVHPVRLDRDSGEGDDIRRKAGALTIADVPALRLREYMIATVSLEKVTTKSGDIVRVPIPAPVKLAHHYIARSDKWRVPVLRGVIETPTLRHDGTLLASEGYDETSGLLVDFNGMEYPSIPDRPSRDDALAALDTLLWPFKDFPFVQNAKGESPSRSVLLSAVLTALVRRVLPTAPLHGFSAPTMGTGKTLACDCVSMIATGRLATAISQGANEEEDEKRLFAVLLAGDAMVLIDNVKRPIEGDALCTILTQTTWQSRILGESRKVSVQTNTLFTASGNNLTFKGDMTTRALLCRMDAQMERPETRRFDVDLKAEVPKRREQLVMAGLTILRAFVVAGRPGLDKLEPFGRFEAWSNLVRGALVWIGEPDPCRTRRFIATDDPERMDFERLLQAIADNIDDWFTAGELIELAEEASDGLLSEAIFSAVPKATPKTLGHYLKDREGRIVGGLKLTSREDKHRKVRRYRVTQV